MTNTIFILHLFVFILFSCKKNENKQITSENKTPISITNNINSIDYIGNWEMENNSNENTFSIKILKSADGKLVGQYCAVARSGAKIDCSPDKEINITEIKESNDGYLVSFNSFFDAKNGEAQLSIKEGKLFWKIIKKPLGEFYCPLESFLTKSSNSTLESKNKSSKTFNINSENFKGEDISMELYKSIIDEYSCGEYTVNGKNLGKFNSYEIFIVKNDCGDFPFKDLISVGNGKIVDKLNIESSSFDIEKLENQKTQNQTDKIFDIKNFSEIKIKEVQTVDGEIKSSTDNIYFISEKGNFEKK